MSEPTCKQRVGKHYKSRMETIRTLWELYKKGEDDWDEADKETASNEGTFKEFGLGFWYNPPGTWKDQRRGVFVWQFGCGGPQDEIRFYATERFGMDRAEYWFLDWFDGAKRVVRAKKDLELVTEIWDFFKDCGTVEAEYNKAVNDVDE